MDNEERTKETSLYVGVFELQIALCIGLCVLSSTTRFTLQASVQSCITQLCDPKEALKVLCIIFWKCKNIFFPAAGFASSCKPYLQFGSLNTTLYY